MRKFTDPLLLVNFKTYLESTGKRAVELSKKLEKVGENEGVKVAVAPQFCDIRQVAASVEIPVYAQHIDTVEACTGYVLPESVKTAGADGTIINHSEKPLLLRDIGRAVERARSVELMSVVCAGTSKLAAAISLSEPDMVAIEPPELIGSGRAVSKENPEIVKDSVRRIRALNSKVRILCGAGISTGDDLYAALCLGTQGVIVSSGVVKAAKPEIVAADLCKAARRFG